MKGYHTPQETHAAAKGLRGFAEVICRGDRWESPYPPGNTAKIHVLSPPDFKFEQAKFKDVDDGFEYINQIGARMKVIYASNAGRYPMPKRW